MAKRWVQVKPCTQAVQFGLVGVDDCSGSVNKVNCKRAVIQDGAGVLKRLAEPTLQLHLSALPWQSGWQALGACS